MAKLSQKLFTFGKFKGQAMGGRNLVATVEGGPELARKMAELEKKARNDAAKAGVVAMGEPIAEAWRERAPVLDENYQRSITTGKVRSNKKGATGIVHPAPLADVADDEQPWAYASRLEYGDADRQAQPSARPAFDATSSAAVDAAAAAMSKIVMEVAE